MHIAVVGAGVFGGWTALYLRRGGARVTLLDAWGPGNSRASSGGETRVIRATYGPDKIYTELVARALKLWPEHEERWKKRLFYPTGALWMAGKDDRYERAALPVLREFGLPVEELTARQVAARYPQINVEGVEWAIFEKEAGYLTARANCQSMLDGFLEEGGKYRQTSVTPGAIQAGRIGALRLANGSTLAADTYVFACGPWLPKLFPEVLGSLIHPTRQEVFFFGTPADDSRYNEGALPVWIDNGERIFYGIPGNQHRGFKVADDSRGPEFDPTNGDRTPTPERIAEARRYLGVRFPGMKDAPLVEARVCQYENSRDGHYILDRHPQAENVWLLGGGSGHGYKVGPALGEMAAEVVLGKRAPEPFFQLKRFAQEAAADGPKFRSQRRFADRTTS